jgi:hypothetical protein
MNSGSTHLVSSDPYSGTGTGQNMHTLGEHRIQGWARVGLDTRRTWIPIQLHFAILSEQDIASPPPLPGSQVPGAIVPSLSQVAPGMPSAVAAGLLHLTRRATWPSPLACTCILGCFCETHPCSDSSNRSLDPFAQRLSVAFPQGWELVYRWRVFPEIRQHFEGSAPRSRTRPLASPRTRIRSRSAYRTRSSERRARTSAWLIAE